MTAVSLFPSTRIGPCELSIQLGAGELAETCRAPDRDRRLGCDVAIRVLLVMASFILVGPPTSAGQEFEIGIIDIYGLNRVPATQVRQTLTFKEGDRISPMRSRTRRKTS